MAKPPKPPKPFHNPFGELKLPPKPAPPGPKRPEPARAKPAAPSRALSEEELWSLATEGADPLADRSGRIRPDRAPIAMAHEPLDPELQAYDELRALVAGEAPFDIADTDEFIEGMARGLDPGILRRLRKGDYAVQGHVDLHGLVREEAKAVLEAYLNKARHDGKRCVLAVHGRGLHSKDQVPVLKEALKRWMGTARFAQHVLAFATARSHDGGAGAVYLLLKRG